MKRKIAFYILIITSFAIVCCNSHSTKEPTIDSSTTDTALVDDENSESSSEIPSDYESEESPSNQQPEPTQNRADKSTNATPSVGGKETLYISTYGANGKVWGHVTMNGNKGRGTIHDDDENSYSITVTRHGGELHGIDQNGREYVFRM